VRTRQAVRLLREAGVKLDLSDETIATAAVFFHRFYAEHSPADFCCATMTMSCLFLSAKASEQQRKARDVINVFNAISSEAGAPPMPICQEFWDRKDLLVEYESYLLRAMAFNVEVALPHRRLLNYARSLRAPRALVQAAWGLLNDHFETADCTEEPPQAVACAALQLAALLLRRELGAPAAPAAAEVAPSEQTASGRGGRGRGGRGRGGRGRARAAVASVAPGNTGVQEPLLPASGAGDCEPRNWHETFGVSVAALEKVAAQLASNYPAETAGVGGPAPSAPPLGNGAGPPAKRARLADDRELHRSGQGST
jgi:hypothetical protein